MGKIQGKIGKVKKSGAPTDDGVPPIIGNINESINIIEINLIDKLNNDCLAKVLSYVPILERLEMENVCKKWKEAAELSWYDVKKLELNKLMITLDKKDETLEMIMIKCGRYLTHLAIIGDQYPWMCNVLKNNCQNISHFSIINMEDVDKYKIPNENLAEIIESMKKLKYLKIKINNKDFCYNVLDRLPKNMTEIHLMGSFFQENLYNDFVPILDKFNVLHCLTLQEFALTNETLEGILKNKNTLSKLDLSHCKFPSHALSIFKNLKNLEHLNLDCVSDFNVNEILSIAHNCSKLKYFEFGNTMVPFNIYRELKYLNLEHLSIYNVDKSDYEDENMIAALTNNWKQLKYLDINRGYGFSTTDLEEITKLNKLEYINLHDADVDSESLINIASNCLELKKLIIYFNRKHVSETALEKLTNLDKIERLTFFRGNNLSDNVLSKISSNCKNLIELTLWGLCRNITEDSLLQVGKMKNLKTLNIAEIKNVPNAMFDCFRKLEYLSCSYCSGVIDEGIIKVIDNCPKLYHLNLWKTGITVKTPIHASKRKFIFTTLTILIDSSVENDYIKNHSNSSTNSYVIINDKNFYEI